LASKYGSSFQVASSSGVVDEASSLIAEGDLSLTALALKFFVTLLTKQPTFGPALVAKVRGTALKKVIKW
jgi:hypothetical protein